MVDNASGINIMVLESDSIVAGDLRQSLERAGYRVTMPDDPENALLWAKREQPQLVVTDVSLKEKWDGIDIAGRIWRQLTIPVVYLSANTDRETVERSLQTFPFGYLIKPFDDLELRTAVELALNQYRYIQELCAANRDQRLQLEKLLQEAAVQETAAAGCPPTETAADEQGSMADKATSRPEELESALERSRSTPTAVFIVWGEDHLLFYNDSAQDILAGYERPAVMGAPAEEWWPELWNILQPWVEQVYSQGTVISSGDLYLPVYNPAGVRESYISLICAPLKDRRGIITGAYCQSRQRTEIVLGRRRLKTIHRLAVGFQDKTADLAAKAGQVLGTAFRDFPFSLLYRRQGNRATLIASSGVDPASPIAPLSVKLRENRYLPWAYPFLQVAVKAAPELVGNLTSFCPELTCGMGETPRQALVLPLHGQERVAGFLVLGLSPRLPYDEDYLLFGQTLAEMMAGSLFPAESGVDRYRLEEEPGMESEWPTESISPAMLKAVINFLPAAVVVANGEGKVLAVNRAAGEFLGFHEPTEFEQYNRPELLSELFEHHYPGRETVPFDQWPLSRVCRGEQLAGLELELTRCDTGVTKTAVYDSLAVKNRRGEIDLAILMIRDITNYYLTQRQLKESGEHYKLLADTVPCILFISLTDGTFNYLNRRFFEYTGLPAEDILGRGWDRLLSPEDWELFSAKWKEATLSSRPFEGEFRLKSRHGDYHWFMVSSQPVGIDADRITWFGSCINIDDIKKGNSDLRSSLEQKEIILKEVHHRVKNNMQLISSLLRLQFGSSRDQKVTEALRQSQNRIRSIALVHEKLYGANNLNSVNLREYLSDLADSLYRSMEVDRSRISLKIASTEQINLGMDLAIPCGLIVTELLSNSLRHAYPGEKKGEIEIIIRPAGPDRLELIHRDDGVGLPAGVDPRQAASLGLQLVFTLATKQLNGELELSRMHGSEFRIRFPLIEERS